MSLQLRLLVSVVAALLLSVALSGTLAVLRAADSVRTEVSAALDVGQQVIRNGIADLGTPQGQPGEVIRLVATFDGNRHLRAVLADDTGLIVTQSHPRLADPPVPGWFVWLVRPHLATPRFALPAAFGGGGILLQPEPADEAGEVWESLGDTAIELGSFCALTLALVLVAALRALRPLRAVAAALERIGGGDYTARVAPMGALEVVRLCHGLNRMAERLASVAEQNHRLQAQILSLQEEERAELARDLHDEIGPLLFSVQVTASGIERLLAGGRHADIPAEIAAIRAAVAQMQGRVRGILQRLRPLQAIEFGLAQAVESLATFWSRHHPATQVGVEVDAAMAELDLPLREACYRVVQEGLSNAFRHGRPSRVGVELRRTGQQVTARVTDDGSTAAPACSGFGLAGMRERVAALGGALRAGLRPDRPGWEVLAILPCPPAADNAAPIAAPVVA